MTWATKKLCNTPLPHGNDSLGPEAELNKMLLSEEFDKPAVKHFQRETVKSTIGITSTTQQ